MLRAIESSKAPEETASADTKTHRLTGQELNGLFDHDRTDVYQVYYDPYRDNNELAEVK